MAEIFISYSRADGEAINGLVSHLKVIAYEPWHDQALTGGKPWWDNILAEIRACEFFITALTPDWQTSQACKLELDYARALGKPVLPVMLSKQVNMNSLPLAVTELQIVDFTSAGMQAIAALANALKKLPKAPALPEPLPPPPPAPISYLTTMKEKVEAPCELDHDQQIALVFQLKNCFFRDHRPANEVCELLHLMKASRKDLFADVAEEIDDVVAQIKLGPRKPVSTPSEQPIAQPVAQGRERAHTGDIPKSAPRTKKPTEARKAPEPRNGAPAEKAPEDESQLVRMKSAAEDCRMLIERVLDRGEVWLLAIDAANSFTVAGSVETACIAATASLRDGVTGAKSKALKALGWEVEQDAFIKSALGSAALYATSGLAALALLSRNVRDVILSFSAVQSWRVKLGEHREDLVARAAAELAEALQAVAADAKTVTATRKLEAPSLSAATSQAPPQRERATAP